MSFFLSGCFNTSNIPADNERILMNCIMHASAELAQNELETQAMFCFSYHCTVLSRWTRNEWLLTYLHLALFMKSHTINNWLLSGRSNTQALKMACSFLPEKKRTCAWFFLEITGWDWEWGRGVDTDYGDHLILSGRTAVTFWAFLVFSPKTKFSFLANIWNNFQWNEMTFIN